VQERNKRKEIDRWVDREADRMIDRGRRVTEKGRRSGSGALFNTFNSIIISIIIDYYKQLTQELSHARATSEASCESVRMSLTHASRLRLITITMEAPQA